jgi:hypothetical protein
MTQRSLMESGYDRTGFVRYTIDIGGMSDRDCHRVTHAAALDRRFSLDVKIDWV